MEFLAWCKLGFTCVKECLQMGLNDLREGG